MREVIKDARGFGAAVHRGRKALGLSQADLAKSCGCSQRFVSEVERGKATAELGKALRLFEVLGIDLVADGGVGRLDGRAEVRDAIERIAKQTGETKKKRKPLSYYLVKIDDE